uniref:CPG4 domain-containing protein n=1 Tax=Panagrellus redivivus TaxID=6233 RepID=A0A7E4ZSL1_PANRE
MRCGLLCFTVLVAVARGQNLSDCVKACLRPIASLHMTNADIYLNYEKICDKLEPAAECAHKCGQDDHLQFHQLVTNFKLHCLEFEEELEPHLECLAEHAPGVDTECKKLCKQEHDDTPNGKQIAACKTSECNMQCQVQKLSRTCPRSSKVQKKISIRKAQELEKAREHEQFRLMPLECQNLHDSKHVARLFDDL